MIFMLDLMKCQELTGEKEIKEKGRWYNRELMVPGKGTKYPKDYHFNNLHQYHQILCQ